MTRPVRVRWVPTHPSPAIASARMRCHEPQAALAARGWDSNLLRRNGWFERPDIVVFQKAYEPAHLRLARRLHRQGTRVVLDVCDNHFDHPADNPVLADRARRLREMVAVSDLVTASTPTLASLVPHGRVHVVDDFIEEPREVRLTALPPRDGLPVVAWFGNVGSDVPRFGIVDLEAIVPELEEAAAVEPFRLVVCTSSREAFEARIGPHRVPSTFVPWSPAAQGEILASAAAAVLPITPNPFTLCKTANRVATALLHGAPVIAGRVPSYEEFHPFIRFERWRESVVEVLRDPVGAWRQVEAGRDYVARRFAPEAIVRQWERALHEALA